MLPYLAWQSAPPSSSRLHVLTGDVLDDVGAGDEHVALIAHRDHQVGLDRRVDRSARAFAEDERDLRAPGRDSISWRRPSSAYQASDVAASWMRAPPESLMPMIGQPTMATHSISRATLRPNISPTVPWNTVWSWLNTPTGPAVDGAVAGDHAVAEERVGIAGSLAPARRSRRSCPGRAGRGCATRALGMPFLSRRAFGLLVRRVPWPAPASRAVRPASRRWCDAGWAGTSFLACPLLAPASIRLIASLMCAPTLAMYGSSMAWMCSPPMGTTSRSATNSPQPPSGLRVAYAGSNVIASSW